MSKTREKKQEEVAELVAKLQRMKSVVLSTIQGVKVFDVTRLRRQMRESGIDYVVVKKTLLERALKEAGLGELLVADVEGGVALAVSFEDEVAPAKLLATFQKEHESVLLTGGIVNGVVYSAAQVKALAALPSRQELVAKLLGTMQNPLTNFLRVTNGPLRGLMQVLRAASEAKEA